jgi:hypothetical protein
MTPRLREGPPPDDPGLARLRRLTTAVRPAPSSSAAEKTRVWQALRGARRRPARLRLNLVAAVALGVIACAGAAAAAAVVTRWIETRNVAPEVASRTRTPASPPGRSPVVVAHITSAALDGGAAAATPTTAASAPAAAATTHVATSAPAKLPRAAAAGGRGLPRRLASSPTEVLAPPTRREAAPEGRVAPEGPLARATVEVPAAHPEPVAVGPDANLVSDALRALRAERAPDKASQLLARYLRLHPDGLLAEDALALAIEAAAARRDHAAGQLGASYLARYPQGRFRGLASEAVRRYSRAGEP